MMEKRPIVCVTDTDGKLYPLGGNMRFKALQQLDYKEIPDNWVTLADNWTIEQRNQFVIKDNIGYGEWDWDDLANNWDEISLEEWGLNVPVFETNNQQTTKDDDVYDFENFDNTGTTTIRIILPDDKAKLLIDKIDAMKGEFNTSDYIFEHFCN
jgi:hypothetical protein